MRYEADDFFRLNDPYEEIESADGFWGLVHSDDQIKIQNYLYRPDALVSKEHPKKWRVRNKRFLNFSFAKTHIDYIEFTDCQFENCLFTGANITNSRFNNCKFINCNFYRTEIQNCFIDPRSFEHCMDKTKYANIGVGLFQELLNNSRQQAQPAYSREAQFQFSRWQRYLKWADIRQPNIAFRRLLKTLLEIFLAWIFEITTGSGTRLRNLVITSMIALTLVTVINYFGRYTFGLEMGGECVRTFGEVLYFTIIVVTSVGFGDITPTSSIGQFVVALEAVGGFITFALLVSMIFKRITD